MTRYLKLVKMKSKDGKAITPPACCVVCQKNICPLSCPDYDAAIRDVKCTEVEMEFGLVDEGGDVVRKCIGKGILLVVVGCIPFSLYLLSQNVKQKCDVSVERYAIDKAAGAVFGISYFGMTIDTNVVMSVVTTAADAVAKDPKRD